MRIKKTWVYHSKLKPKVIPLSDLASYKDNGWSDTPMSFVNLKDCGIDVDDPVAVNEFGQAIQGVRDSLNGALNIALMKKAALVKYIFEHYGIEISEALKVTIIRKQVRKLINGDSQ